jgi:hypothetical protein
LLENPAKRIVVLGNLVNKCCKHYPAYTETSDICRSIFVITIPLQYIAERLITVITEPHIINPSNLNVHSYVSFNQFFIVYLQPIA